ncbi:hypothetical protein SUGI_0074990 [Cryptomeria japonica]|uniref:uncharacterized protein LOC131039776 n=1 Tax=Cryptomeria japonica TaxID=3369 RepID=UPI002408ECF6|nr:uncharacterized protein LOC131039776 [Cryptomeria japonica]GLJ07830.1 hypothetical protein SUGI_0074990 [Cryptomeria japonica]
MAGLLKKRCREDEAPLTSPKRSRAETEKLIFELLEEEEKCTASEEVVNGIMRSLEEEIGLTSCSTSYDSSSGSKRDESVSSDMTSRYGDSGEINLDYLLEASDDELGIPLQNSEEDHNLFSSSSKEEFLNPCFGSAENQEFKGFVDNWFFEDDLEDYRQFAVFDDAAAFDLARSEHLVTEIPEISSRLY